MRSMGSGVSFLERIEPMDLAVWSTTKPSEGGTLTGREPDNAADHAERPPARVPRLRGQARFMGRFDLGGKAWPDFEPDKELIVLKGLTGKVVVQANY